MVKCIKSATALLRLAALHHFILHSTVKRPSEMFQTAFLWLIVNNMLIIN
jgi:hypothetical protein